MLRISGQKTIERSPEDLWALLMDEKVLRQCIPGCQSLEVTGANRYRLCLKIGHGIFKGRFQGEVGLTDVAEPESCRLDLQAKGPSGRVRGTTDVRLVRLDHGEGTEVLYDCTARVGGLLRAIGPGVFQKMARSFADQFFQELARFS
jgi:carbon monoxide dehydrogenase subunit G